MNRTINIDLSNTNTGGKHFYETLSKADQSRITGAVKALNERLRDLKRRGMEGTQSYKNLQSWVASMPQSKKTGTITYQSGKTEAFNVAKQTYKLTPKQIQRTLAIYNAKDKSGNPLVSAGGDIRAVLDLYDKAGIPTPDASRKDVHNAFVNKVIQNAKKLGSLHEIITTKQHLYYGTEMEDWVHRKSNLTLQEAFAFFNLVDNEDQAAKANRENWERYKELKMNNVGENS